MSTSDKKTDAKPSPAPTGASPLPGYLVEARERFLRGEGNIMAFERALERAISEGRITPDAPIRTRRG